MVVLEHDGEGRLQLAGRHELVSVTDTVTNETKVAGYSFSSRLRVLPTEVVHKVRVRMSHDD
jgi:hypothetical protein